MQGSIQQHSLSIVLYMDHLKTLAAQGKLSVMEFTPIWQFLWLTFHRICAL